MIDLFTKWAEARAVPDQKSGRLIEFLKDTFNRFGFPQELIHDQGPNFMSKETQDFLHSHGIRSKNTSGYRPQCNGMVERLNRTLTVYLSKYVKENKKNWDALLNEALSSYNKTVQKSTGKSPFNIVYSTRPKLPIDNKLPTIIEESIDIEQLREQVKENITKSHEASKKRYDQRVKQVAFRVGDEALLAPTKLHKKIHKLEVKQYQGPFKIIKQMSPVNFKVQLHGTNQLPFTTHVDRLKKFIRRDKTAAPSNDRVQNFPQEESMLSHYNLRSNDNDDEIYYMLRRENESDEDEERSDTSSSTQSSPRSSPHRRPPDTVGVMQMMPQASAADTPTAPPTTVNDSSPSPQSKGLLSKAFKAVVRRLTPTRAAGTDDSKMDSSTVIIKPDEPEDEVELQTATNETNTPLVSLGTSAPEIASPAPLVDVMDIDDPPSPPKAKSVTQGASSWLGTLIFGGQPASPEPVTNESPERTLVRTQSLVSPLVSPDVLSVIQRPQSPATPPRPRPPVIQPENRAAPTIQRSRSESTVTTTRPLPAASAAASNLPPIQQRAANRPPPRNPAPVNRLNISKDNMTKKSYK